MNEDLILEENVKVHDAESEEYSFLHPEQYNTYQLTVLQNHIGLISDLVSSKKRDLLDLGCGEGYLTLPFLGAGFSCTSVDVSSGMLEKLKSKIPVDKIHDVKLVNKDIRDYVRSCRKNFDVIGISGVLHHMKSFDNFIQAVSKRLKKSGFLFITHEPLKQNVKPSFGLRMHNLLRLLDEFLYTLTRKPQRYSEKYDYKVTDYQRQFGGISPDTLIEVLEKNGLIVLIVSKFCVRRYGLFAFIANEIICSENTFAILAFKL